MTTPTESQSYQLIDEMERLQAEVTASFAKTDAVIAKFGLTRERLAPLLNEQRARLSEADRLKLEKLENNWRNELTSALEGDHQRSTKRMSRGMRLGLITRI